MTTSPAPDELLLQARTAPADLPVTIFADTFAAPDTAAVARRPVRRPFAALRRSLAGDTSPRRARRRGDAVRPTHDA